MSRKLTTAFGIAAMSIAVIGILWTLVMLIPVFSMPDEWRSLFLWERGLSLAAKAGLLATGLTLLLRSRLALPLLVCTLLVSVADSVLVYGWLLPPLPAGLSPAGQAGRVFGRMAGLCMPPVLYVALICYLLLPQTRAEFGSRRMSAVRAA